MNSSLKGKVVIITGASSGIGLACVHEFARRGSYVVLAARSSDTINNEVNTLLSKGFKAIAVTTDVSKEADCKHLIDETIREFGRVDILINNAGVSMRGLFANVDLKVIRYLMEVNFFGTIYCTKYALPHLLKVRGSVVGVSSIAGFHGLPGRTGYSASKFAMHGFLETLRIEHLRNGLHVMIAAPGFTATNVRFAALRENGEPQGYSPRQEGKMMKPEAVARRIARGVMYRRRNLIMTFEGKISVFLQRIIPHLLDYIFYKTLSREQGMEM